VKCVAPDSKLKVDDENELKDLTLDLSIVPGEIPPEFRERARLPEEAIGGIWWETTRKRVSGQLYLLDVEYKALWDQIRQGDRITYTIELRISPLAYSGGDTEWAQNPVFIESAVFKFELKAQSTDPDEDQIKPKLLWQTERDWARNLFVVAAVAVFVDSLKINVAAAAVLVVGGLLLWFGSWGR
jgi:hypothetical protein